ncbi:MAG: hypothetical protein H8D62_01650 [Bacteroidetes bacterium]|nr:hypothetical protein [Bacteroidota bacterium]
MKIISFSEVPDFLKQKELFQATITQLQKDLSWQNLELPLGESPTVEELKIKLSSLFSYLEQGQYQTLMNILYRVDVSEQQIKKAMENVVDEPFSDVLAQLMLHRCLQKVIIKQHFSKEKNTDEQDLLNQ